MKYLTLRNGVKMPIVGFGTYKIKEPNEARAALECAIKAGYRLIDTAQVYENEELVGEAIANSNLPREEFFITTKIRVSNFDDPVRSLEESFKKLRTDYIDLVLIHWPYQNYFRAYKALEDYYKQGKIRAIGVSNFDPGRLIDLIHYVEIPPMVNQIEANIYAQRFEEMKWYNKYGVIVQAHSPLGHGVTPQLHDEMILKEIGAKHHKTNAQIALKYLIQRGIAVVPKSSHENRIIENISLFDFELDDKDMREIILLDKNYPVVGRPEDPVIVEKILSKD